MDLSVILDSGTTVHLHLTTKIRFIGLFTSEERK